MIRKRLIYFNGNKHDTINTHCGGVNDIHLQNGMAIVEYDDGKIVYIISSYIRLLVKNNEYEYQSTDY